MSAKSTHPAILCLAVSSAFAACEIQPVADRTETMSETPAPGFTLGSENTHNRWSRTIPPVLTVPSGAVVEVRTKEASDGQIIESTDGRRTGECRFWPDSCPDRTDLRGGCQPR